MESLKKKALHYLLDHIPKEYDPKLEKVDGAANTLLVICRYPNIQQEELLIPTDIYDLETTDPSSKFYKHIFITRSKYYNVHFIFVADNIQDLLTRLYLMYIDKPPKKIITRRCVSYIDNNPKHIQCVFYKMYPKDDIHPSLFLPVEILESGPYIWN